MISKLVIAGLVVPAGALGWFGAAAHADEINTAGAVCQSFSAATALDIDYQPNGVQNTNAAARSVICSIPRSAGVAGNAPMFYVDGQSNPGTCTSCTIAIYHFYGVMAASQSFTRCTPATGATSWDQFVSFSSSAALISPDDYVSAVCTIPGNGLIYGVTEIQP